jgi:hypothetical protein
MSNHDIKEATPAHLEADETIKPDHVPGPTGMNEHDTKLYMEALELYGHDGAIDPEAEKRLKRYVQSFVDESTSKTS